MYSQSNGPSRHTLTLGGKPIYTITLRDESHHSLELETPVAIVYYDEIHNKPTINGVEINGDLTLEDLGLPDFSDAALQPLTIDELEEILAEQG